MYRSILVPLDGSSFAEQALPFALLIAERANATIHLATVHELSSLSDPHAGRAPFSSKFDEDHREKEFRYLENIARSIGTGTSISVATDFPSGSAAIAKLTATGVLERAQADSADLLVLCGHRPARVYRLLFGSVADELMRRADIPILLTPVAAAGAITPEAAQLDRVLVALDGSPHSEEIVDPAMQFARLMNARVELLRVLEPSSSRADRPNSQEHRAQAEAYLERFAQKFRDAGLIAETLIRTDRHVADAIVKSASGPSNCAIALATHGRSGLERLALGSVAEKVVRSSPNLVLLYRPDVGSAKQRETGLHAVAQE